MKKSVKLLLIDDDESLCRVLEHQLSELGFAVTIAPDGRVGLDLFEHDPHQVVITDLAMPAVSGMEVLREIRSRDSGCIIIIITAYGTVENAIEACNLGADDYITKPFSIEQLRFTIEKALRFRALERENISLKTQLDENYGMRNLVGQSVAMQEVYRLMQKVAPTDTTVLIQGESGTGKELIARAIHAMSNRAGNPFVPVDCAAIPEALLESELFGHVRGSFTGAIKDRKGKFESADNGTLFLDEIGELKESLQAKLLRTLQEKQVAKVGSDRPVPVNVRIIAATNRDLARDVAESAFRQDLYYRLAVIVVKIPPLRERREDIHSLVKYFLDKYKNVFPLTVEKEVYKSLVGYDWPGNVRELENVIERAVVLSEGGIISVKDLSEEILHPPSSAAPAEARSLVQIEKNAIENALQEARGNQTQAARLLGIPRHVLLYRIKKWGIGISR